jgi:hypothetical protein
MAKKFIQRAVKREGRVKAIAKREGGLNPDGTIKASWLRRKIAKMKGKGDRSMMSALVLARRFKGGDLAKS